MKNISLGIVTIILIFVYLIIPSQPVEENENLKEDVITVFDLSLEEYIIGVVAAEMPASFYDEAIKAQAIASRSYAMNLILDGIDLTTDVSTQSYITIEEMKVKWGDEFDYYYEKIENSVYETENLVMKYEDEIITAFYFSISNGYTAESTSVFGESLDYIESVESLWDLDVNNYEVISNFEYTTFCELLDISCENLVVENIEYNEISQVESINISGVEFSGVNFRSLLGLRSTTFEISFEDEVYITTKGYGHGVGMSQYGANEMAKEGYTYEEILYYYYKDIEISNI